MSFFSNFPVLLFCWNLSTSPLSWQGCCIVLWEPAEFLSRKRGILGWKQSYCNWLPCLKLAVEDWGSGHPISSIVNAVKTFKINQAFILSNIFFPAFPLMTEPRCSPWDTITAGRPWGSSQPRSAPALLPGEQSCWGQAAPFPPCHPSPGKPRALQQAPKEAFSHAVPISPLFPRRRKEKGSCVNWCLSAWALAALSVSENKYRARPFKR